MLAEIGGDFVARLPGSVTINSFGELAPDVSN
jgi:hypothetical protein